MKKLSSDPPDLGGSEKKIPLIIKFGGRNSDTDLQGCIMADNDPMPIDQFTVAAITCLPREERIARQEWLAEVACLHGSSSVKRSAMVALREISSPLVRPISLLTLTHELENENLRETAIKCLGEVGTEDDLVLLQELSQNEQIARSASKRL